MEITISNNDAAGLKAMQTQYNVFLTACKRSGRDYIRADGYTTGDHDPVTTEYYRAG